MTECRERDYWRGRSRLVFLFHNLVTHPLFALTETADAFATWLHDWTTP